MTNPWEISNFGFMLLLLSMLHSVLGWTLMRYITRLNKLLDAQVQLSCEQIEISNARTARIEDLAVRVEALEASDG